MKKGFMITILIGLISLFSACTIPNLGLSRKDISFETMDTYISGYAYLDNEKHANLDIEKDIKAIYDKIDSLTDNFEDDKVYLNNVFQMNKALKETDEDELTFEIDPLLYELMALALEVEEITNGYFNFYMGDVIDVWKDLIQSSPKEEVSFEDVNQVKDKVNAIEIVEKGVSLNETDGKFYVTLKKGSKLDFGAIAKGFATQKAKEYLEDHEVTIYNISGGTSSIVLGVKFGSIEEFMIGMRDPLDPFDIYGYAYATIKNTSITTSGSYEQYVVDPDNNWYHHIVSPKTKMPANYYLSLTIIGEDAGFMDALSTALFCMDEKTLEAFLTEHPYEAVIYRFDGTKRVFNQNTITLRG